MQLMLYTYVLLAECEENSQLVGEMVDVLLGMANDEESPMDSSSQGM